MATPFFPVTRLGQSPHILTLTSHIPCNFHLPTPGVDRLMVDMGREVGRKGVDPNESYFPFSTEINVCYKMANHTATSTHTLDHVLEQRSIMGRMISGSSVPFLTRNLLKHSIGYSLRSISNERQLENFRSHLSRHKKLSAEKKDLILTILHSTATKREVRDYLSKYPLLKGNDIYENPTKLLGRLSEQDIASETITDHDTDEHLNAIRNQKYDKLIDNLLTKYSDSPDVSLDKSLTEFPQPNEIQLSDTLRIAFIKIANLNKLTVEITKGIGLTIYKMVQLGVSPVIVLDLDYKDHENKQLMIKTITEYSNSLIHVLESEKKLLLRPIRGLFDYDEESKNFNFSVPELLTIPLLQGIIPILFPIATSSKSEEMIMDTFQVIQSAAHNLSSLNTKFKQTNDSDLLSIEKIVYIDPIGGLPSLERFQSSHVYVNLLQEYDDITSELYIGHLKPSLRDSHLKNLTEMNELLTILPNATGLITTPEIATLKHGKRATNPIIYNILTDRPTISSSLPVNLKKMPLLNTTIIKRGMEIRVYLSEDEFPEFTPGMHHRDELSEESGEVVKPRGIDLLEFEKRGIVDLKKLKHLIDDSFGRDLNMHHYLNRINGKVAALIIAGDFEGGAVITWETSPVAKEGSTRRYVPYLDKFAVLRHLQGVPGLADIVFKSVLTSFPHELLWRSRITNPVNKWYFERSLGDFVVSCDKEGNGPEWRLFWSGSRIRDKEDFVTYDEICKSIEPSFHKK